MKSPGDQVRCKKKCCKSGTRCKKCPVVWKRLSKQGFAEPEGRVHHDDEDDADALGGIDPRHARGAVRQAGTS